METVITPGALRGKIAERQALLYHLAAKVGIHPGKLGRMLNERVPLPPDVGAKILEALDRGKPA